MPYLISDKTKTELQDLINRGPDTTGSRIGSSLPKTTCFVRCDGAGEVNVGTIQQVDSRTITVEDFAECYIVEVNGFSLVEGRSYAGWVCGAYAGVYVVAISTVPAVDSGDPGCGLYRDGLDRTALYAPAVAGYGLFAASNCVLGVNYDCHLLIEDSEYGSGLSVDTSTLGGTFLVQELGEEGDCPRLTIQYGCGLHQSPGNTLSVKASDLAGAGLLVAAECQMAVDLDYLAEELAGCGLVNDDGKLGVSLELGYGLTDYNCGLAIYYGCGLDASSGGQLKVKASDLAGDGLGVDGCALKINTGCGLQISPGDTLSVKATDLAGTFLEASGTCALRVKATSKTKTVITGIYSAFLDCDSGALTIYPTTETITYLEPT